jgi:2-keto-4-pentenoate hydratase/2-oxohepta-3-ene-1,7-dioic acid hydratase in catechol pathway
VKLCTFSCEGAPPRPGRVEGTRVIRLAAESLAAVLAAGGEVPADGEFQLADVRLCAPIPAPPSVRDFFAFEAHVATARANRGATVPAEWYEIPVFYFSNPAAIFGPDDAIPYPQASAQLDYELEVAAIVGTGGRIAGFTVMNDWSARDLQRQEVSVGLGPAKGKDFATSLGPLLVTVDEFDGSEAEMVARVNGEERSRGNLRDLFHPWKSIMARAALNTNLRPGDVIGSGTVGTGCILEHGDGRWLSVGDVVELEIEGIGVLRNTVAPPTSGTEH